MTRMLSLAAAAVPVALSAARPVPKTSVLDVFGTNLRMLTEARGTHSAVARDLDVSRIQFRRYLKGESFPKPHLLQRICKYFGVDARILTEPLTDALLGGMALDRNRAAVEACPKEWMVALSYAAPKRDYFRENPPLNLGLYAVWYWSPNRANSVTRMRISIFERLGVRLMRGYHGREAASPEARPADREFRGACLATRQGHSILVFQNGSCDAVSNWYLSPAYLPGARADVLVGFSAIGRNELPNLPRISRLVMERIDVSRCSLVREAHFPCCWQIDRVPEAIRGLLGGPLG